MGLNQSRTKSMIRSQSRISQNNLQMLISNRKCQKGTTVKWMKNKQCLIKKLLRLKCMVKCMLKTITLFSFKIWNNHLFSQRWQQPYTKRISYNWIQNHQMPMVIQRNILILWAIILLIKCQKLDMSRGNQCSSRSHTEILI